MGLATGGLSCVLAAGLGAVAMHRVRRPAVDPQITTTDEEEVVSELHSDVLR